MRTLMLAGIWGALLLAGACQRDPGRDVRRMPDPLGPAGASATPTEIIPLDEVRKSQAAAVSQRVANTEITVTYSRPVARGREIFGGLVPYDQVWNPGADQATAISFTRDVTVNGQSLPAGTYSFWIIPRQGLKADAAGGSEDTTPTTWTAIFNSAAEVYHTPYPGPDRDRLRLQVRPESGPHQEVLSFDFPLVEGKDAVLRLHWGETIVPLSIRVP